MINPKELDTPITSLSGAKIMLTADQPLTYRSALVSACETYQPSNHGEGSMLKAFNLGLKIINAKDKLDVNEDDMVFLKQVIESNKAFMSVIVGRLLEFINKSN